MYETEISIFMFYFEMCLRTKLLVHCYDYFI